MSALQQQLQAHRQAAPVAPTGGLSKQKASLLFDRREAADLDVATVKDIGCNGLAELVSLDARFTRFEEALFNVPLSTSTERHMMTPDAVKELNKTIEQFLQLASPFLPLKATHKALEFLIRRYHIEVYNVDALMISVLPYHETDLFVKVLSLPVQLENTKWQAFKVAQKNKKTVTRHTLAKYIIAEPSMLQIAFKHVKRCCALHPKHSSAGTQIPSFVAAIVASVLESAKSSWVSEKLLPYLVPHIITAVKAGAKPELQVYGYVLLLSLSSKHQLAKDIAREMGASVVRGIPVGDSSAEVEMRRIAFQCLASYFEFQNGGVLFSRKEAPGTALLAPVICRALSETLGQDEEISVDLSEVLRSFDGAIFTTGLILALLNDYLNAKSLFGGNAKELLEHTLELLCYNKGLAKSTVSFVLKSLPLPKKMMKDSLVKRLFENIAQNFPAVLDATVDKILRTASDEGARENVGQLLLGIFGDDVQYSRHLLVEDDIAMEDENGQAMTTLFIAVNSGDASTRERALSKLSSQIWRLGADEDHAGESLMIGTLSFVPDLVLKLCQEEDARVSLAGFRFLADILTHWSVSPLDTPLGMKKATFLAAAAQMIVARCAQVEDRTDVEDPDSLEQEEVERVEANTQVEKLCIKCCSSFPVMQLAVPELQEAVDVDLLVRSITMLLLSATRSHRPDKSLSDQEVESLAVEALATLAKAHPSLFPLFVPSKAAKKINTVAALIDQCVVPALAKNADLWDVLVRVGPTSFPGVPIVESASETSKQSVLAFQSAALLPLLGVENTGVPAALLTGELCNLSAQLQALGAAEPIITANLEGVVAALGGLSASAQSATLTRVFLVLLGFSEYSVISAVLCEVSSGSCGALVPDVLVAIVSQRAVLSREDRMASSPPRVVWKTLHLLKVYLDSIYVSKVPDLLHRSCAVLVPSLLPLLGHPSREVRVAAISCFDSVRSSASKVGRTVMSPTDVALLPHCTGGEALRSFSLDPSGSADAQSLTALLEAVGAKANDIKLDATCISRILTEPSTCAIVPGIMSFAQLGIVTDLEAGRLAKEAASYRHGEVYLDVCHTRGSALLLEIISEFETIESTDQCAEILRSLLEASDGDATWTNTTLSFLKRVARILFERLGNMESLPANEKLAASIIECMVGQWSEDEKDETSPMGRFLRSSAISLVSKQQIVEHLSEEMFSKLVAVMLNLSLKNSSDHASSRCLQLFRKVDVKDLILTRMLELANAKDNATSSKLDQQLETPAIDSDSWLSHVVLLGEVLSLSTPWSDLSAKRALAHLDALLSLVKIVCDKSQGGDIDSMEEGEDTAKLSYAMSLLLGTSRECAAAVNDKTADGTVSRTARDAVQVEVVVDSIVNAVDPHARSIGLKLLAQTATLCPQRILSEVSPILVRVCDADLSHWEDHESYTVLEQLIKCVVPLARLSAPAKGKRSKGSVELTDILIHFDAALTAASNTTLNHKLDLYSVLVEALTCESGALWATIALLMAKREQAPTPQTGPELAMFCHALLNRCTALEQIAALEDLLVNMENMWGGKRSSDPSAGLMDPAKIAAACMKPLGGPGETAGVALARNVAKFVSDHLSSRSFASHLFALSTEAEEDEDAGGMQEFLGLLQITIREMHRCSQRCATYGRRAADSQGEQPKLARLSGTWNALRAGLEEVLDRVTALLSVPMFVAVVQELVSDESSSVRQIALRQLGLKVKEQHAQWDETEISLLIEQTGTLQEVLEDEDESVVNKQTAVVSIDVIAKHLAPYSPESFLPLARVVVDMMKALAAGSPDSVAGLSQANTELFSSLCLCTATLVSVLGNRTLALFPVYFPLLLEACEQFMLRDDDEAADLHSLLAESGATALLCVVQQLPKFLTPYMQRLVTYLGNAHGLVSDMHQSILDQVQAGLVEGVAPRSLLPATCAAARTLLEAKELSACEQVLVLLADCVKEIPPAKIEERLSDLVEFFVDCLHVRCHALDPASGPEETEEAWEDLESVEAVMLETFMALVMQLRERQLRPMFTRLCDSVYGSRGHVLSTSVDPLDFSGKAAKASAVDSPETGGNRDDRDELATVWVKQCRSATLSLLCKGLLENLNGIFTPMFENLITNIMGELSAEYFEVPDLVAKGSSKRKRGSSLGSKEESLQSLWNAQQLILRTRGVQCLTLFFKHCGALGRALFDEIVDNLVRQLDIFKVTPSGKNIAKVPTQTREREVAWYEGYTSDEVVPCITEFAVACGRESAENVLWQSLHHKTLRMMRHKMVQVRLAALEAVTSCFEELGDDFIILLADTLPYVSELLEDEDPEVRRKAQQLAKLLQNLSGEDIQTYLQ